MSTSEESALYLIIKAIITVENFHEAQLIPESVQFTKQTLVRLITRT